MNTCAGVPATPPGWPQAGSKLAVNMLALLTNKINELGGLPQKSESIAVLYTETTPVQYTYCKHMLCDAHGMHMP